MNLLTARLHRWPAAMTLGTILGLAAGHAVAGEPVLKSGRPNGVPLIAQREAAERPDSPRAKETDKQPERAWWDIESGPPDEGMTIPPHRSPKPERDGFRDLESQLRRRAEAILKDLVELPVGLAAEAPRLEAELKRVHEEIDRLHKDFGRLEREPREPEPDPFEVLGERLELAERAIDVQCLIYELDDEDAERVGDLKDELKEINARLEEILARHPELENDREFLSMQFESHRRAVQRMRQAGKPEAAERFMQDQLAMIRRLEKPLAESPAGQHDDRDRRMKHVEVAIENLRAAGLDDSAERLGQESKRMVDEHRRKGPSFPAPPGRIEPPEMLQDPYRAKGYEPGTANLRRQMDRMQREMDELRELVEKLVEENRRSDRD